MVLKGERDNGGKVNYEKREEEKEKKEKNGENER